MTALTNDFETDLGTVRTWIEIEGNYFKPPGKLTCNTEGYDILLRNFDLKLVWPPAVTKCAAAIGWRWFINKTNEQKEPLTIFCSLVNPASDTTFSPNAGECLDAIEIENRTHHLHIGTEDGEMMQSRARINDWMPERFAFELSLARSFTEYVDFGFKTVVPDLKENERIYFHFIVATNPIRASKDYPGERDVSTWLAVDRSKKWLDEKLEASGR